MNDGDNNKNDYGDERSQIEKAYGALREEALPGFLTAYDKAGPATVLTLALILADAWQGSGFSADEWRELIKIYDVPA
jgi:hypothetical protein